MRKVVMFLAATAAVLGAGYFFWGGERTLTLRFLDLGRESVTHSAGPAFSLRDSLLRKISDFGRGAKETLASKLSSVAEQGESFVGEEVLKAGQAAKEKIYEAVQTLLGAGENPLPSEIVEYFRYLGKVGSPLSFLIKNPSAVREPKALNYEIDWGEGEKTTGSVATGKNTAVSHIWQKEGEYAIKFKIAFGETAEYNYEIKVLILK